MENTSLHITSKSIYYRTFCLFCLALLAYVSVWASSISFTFCIFVSIYAHFDRSYASVADDAMQCNTMHCNHFAYWFCIGKSRFYYGLFLHSSLVRAVVNWCWNWNTLSDYEFTMNMFSVNCLFNLSGAGRESDMWQAPVTITLQYSVSPIPHLNISIRS